MDFALVFAPTIVAALISYALAPLASIAAFWVGAVDRPGPRKIHQTPIPRLGGLAVVAAVFIVGGGTYWLLPWVTWILPQHLYLGIGLGLMPIVVVSLCDDIKPLRARTKFLTHAIGAGIAVSFGVSLGARCTCLGRPSRSVFSPFRFPSSGSSA